VRGKKKGKPLAEGGGETRNRLNSTLKKKKKNPCSTCQRKANRTMGKMDERKGNRPWGINSSRKTREGSEAENAGETPVIVLFFKENLNFGHTVFTGKGEG